MNRILLYLGIALGLSLTGNILQLRSAWIGQGEAKGAHDREVLKGQNEQLSRTAAINKGIALAGREDHKALLGDLAAIAERGRETRVVYRQAAAKTPLAANCAPGKDRVDAVNAGLGPKEK